MSPLALASLSIIVAFLLIFGGFNIIRHHDHLKVAALIIPIVGIYIGVWFLAFEGPTSVLIPVESILIVLEILYFVGPFRTSGWAWPEGGRLKTPRRVFTVLVGLTVAVTAAGGGFILHVEGFFNPDMVYPRGMTWYLSLLVVLMAFGYLVLMAVILAAVAVPSFCAFWSIYFLVSTCFSLDKEDKKGKVSDHWIERSGAHILLFDSDTNGYHVSPKVYEKLTKHNKGAQYSYTVVTGLGGRQFMRTPPVMLPSTPQKDYSEYGSTKDSAAIGTTDSSGTPIVRVLGGDGAFTGVPREMDVSPRDTRNDTWTH